MRSYGAPERKSILAWARNRYGDPLLAAAGLSLGVLCASFPWYVLLNPDQFGVPTVKFDQIDAALPTNRDFPSGSPVFPDRIDPDKVPAKELDPTATGTTIPAQASPEEDLPASEAEQPFPARRTAYRLVEVANGRAMIEDGTSFWIVEPGSTLPDNSVVISIGEVNGVARLVTSQNATLTIDR